MLRTCKVATLIVAMGLALSSFASTYGYGEYQVNLKFLQASPSSSNYPYGIFNNETLVKCVQGQSQGGASVSFSAYAQNGKYNIYAMDAGCIRKTNLLGSFGLTSYTGTGELSISTKALTSSSAKYNFTNISLNHQPQSNMSTASAQSTYVLDKLSSVGDLRMTIQSVTN